MRRPGARRQDAGGGEEGAERGRLSARQGHQAAATEAQATACPGRQVSEPTAGGATRRPQGRHPSSREAQVGRAARIALGGATLSVSSLWAGVGETYWQFRDPSHMNLVVNNDDRLFLRLPAEPQNVALVRQAVGSEAVALGMQGRGIEDLKTVISEACANVVLHAYPGDADQRP